MRISKDYFRMNFTPSKFIFTLFLLSLIYFILYKFRSLLFAVSQSGEENDVLKNLKLHTYNGIKKVNYLEKIVIFEYDLTKSVPKETNSIECVNLKNVIPQYYVCLHENDYISDRVRKALSYEPTIQRLIKLFFANYSEATFVDLGSNIGLHSLYAASLGPTVDVLAVEPFPINAVRLHKAAVMNKVQKQIKLLISALSNRRELVTFKEKKGSVGENSLVRKYSKNEIQADAHAINSICIDDLVPFVKKPTVFLKIDVEGMECFLFMNAYKFFSAFRIPFLLIEVKHTLANGDWCVEMMLNFLQEFKFIPFPYPFEKFDSNSTLNYADWRKWGQHDVFFMQPE